MIMLEVSDKTLKDLDIRGAAWGVSREQAAVQILAHALLAPTSTIGDLRQQKIDFVRDALACAVISAKRVAAFLGEPVEDVEELARGACGLAFVDGRWTTKANARRAHDGLEKQPVSPRVPPADLPVTEFCGCGRDKKHRGRCRARRLGAPAVRIAGPLKGLVKITKSDGPGPIEIRPSAEVSRVIESAADVALVVHYHPNEFRVVAGGRTLAVFPTRLAAIAHRDRWNRGETGVSPTGPERKVKS